MRGEIKAPRGKDSRERVSKLTMVAGKENELDQLKLALIASAVFPTSKETHDKLFDRWLITRVKAYCKANGVRVHIGK